MTDREAKEISECLCNCWDCTHYNHKACVYNNCDAYVKKCTPKMLGQTILGQTKEIIKMEPLIIDGETVRKLCSEALPKLLADALANSYSSPLSAAVKEAVNTQEGTIKTLVREMLHNVLTDQAFKEQLTKEIVGAVIQKGIGR